MRAQRKNEVDASREPRDYFTVHRTLKAEGQSAQAGRTSHAAGPPAEATQQSLEKVNADVKVERRTIEILIESLRNMGFDTKPLESLKNYIEALDKEEKLLLNEIQERQQRLAAIRKVKDLFKRLEG